MKITSLVAALSLCLIIFNGCSTSTRSSRSTQAPPAVVPRSAVADALKQEIVSLGDQTRLAEMRIDSDISAEIVRLKGETQRLTPEANAVGGQAGLDFRKQLDSIGARLEQLERSNAARLPEVQPVVVPAAPGAVVPGQEPVITGSLTGDAATPVYPGQATTAVQIPADPLAGQPSSTTPAPPPSQGSGNYEKGKVAFDQRQYQAALVSFNDYLSAEPNGANAAAAQFYIGESHYAQRQYEEAILEYQEVIQDFPKSSQVPTSLLKQGISFQALGDTESAKLLYRKVMRDYPKSYTAGVAKERLGKL